MIEKIGTAVQDRNGARWHVRYRQDGKPRKKTFRTEADAQAWRQAQIAAAQPVEPSSDKDEGSADWYYRAGTWYAAQLKRATEARDILQIELLGKAVRAYAALSAAVSQHRDMAQVEATVKRLERVQAAQKRVGGLRYGTRLRAASPSSGG